MKNYTVGVLKRDQDKMIRLLDQTGIIRNGMIMMVESSDKNRVAFVFDATPEQCQEFMKLSKV